MSSDTGATHRAIIAAGNWVECDCERGEDHPKTYPIDDIPEWA